MVVSVVLAVVVIGDDGGIRWGEGVGEGEGGGVSDGVSENVSDGGSGSGSGSDGGSDGVVFCVSVPLVRGLTVLHQSLLSM